MIILDIVGNIVTSILIGYLALTNALADRIEMLLPQEAEESIEAPLEEELVPIIEDGQSLSERFIPRVLLDHIEFQRAAAIASRREERAPELPFDEPLEEAVKESLVNVFCQYKTDRFIRTTTGTGFFINNKGVILTNAHVAQFLILENARDLNGNVECVIRSGNPAKPRYTAELLYISPAWIFDNADLIQEEAPRGTGERDYALLYVSKSVDNTPLPAEFPALPVSVNLLTRSVAGSPVITGGYPAEILLTNGADADLAPVIDSASVGNLYTFGSNYADIFSVTESAVGEQGASGGPIASENDRNVIGLIVTKGDEETEGSQSLRAITLSYVDRTITEETGFSLQENMQGDLAYRGAIFKQAMLPFLAEILREELTSQR